jgi:hypothetical protein
MNESMLSFPVFPKINRLMKEQLSLPMFLLNEANGIWFM